MKVGVRAARGQRTWRSGWRRCVSPPSRPASPQRRLARASATRRRARSASPSCRASARRRRSSGGRGHAAGRGSSAARAAARDTVRTSRRCTAPVPKLAWCRATHCRWQLCRQAAGRADGDASSSATAVRQPSRGGQTFYSCWLDFTPHDRNLPISEPVTKHASHQACTSRWPVTHSPSHSHCTASESSWPW